MQLKQATRQQAKIKMALQGPSGAGKTFSALLLSFGLVNDRSKVCIIDTEYGSSILYAHLANYLGLPLEAPFTPENFIEAIQRCQW